MRRGVGVVWLLGCLTSCSASGAQEAGQITFDRLEVPVGVHTTAIVAADLDDDGRLDLAVAGGDRVFLLHARAGGRFERSGPVEAGENPADLTAGDIDGDGRVDLVVANHETDYVTVLFGRPGGDVTTRPHSRVTVGVSPHPHAVVLRDFDRDGRLDLLVDDRDREAVRYFRGRGDGTFAEAESIAVGGDPYRGIATGDLNGDDLPDIATPNPDHVSVLLGDGAGGFTPKATLTPGFAPFSVSVGDFDGDGLGDVAAGSGERVGSLTTWTGMPDGSFREAGRHDIAAGPTTMAAADLTGDGADELVVASYVGGEVAVLTGGTRQVLLRFTVVGYPYHVATGDLDGDGRTDFAVANDGEDHITVFRSR